MREPSHLVISVTDEPSDTDKYEELHEIDMSISESDEELPFPVKSSAS